MAERAAAAISLLEHSSRRARGPLLVSARPALSERLRAQAILIAVPRHRNIILNIEGMCDDLAHVQTGRWRRYQRTSLSSSSISSSVHVSRIARHT